MHHEARILDSHAGAALDQRRAVEENVGWRVRKCSEHFGQRLIEEMCRARHQQDVGTRRFLQSINELQRIGETALDCKLLSRRDRFRQVKHAAAKALRQFAVAAVAVEKIANVAAEIEKYPGIRQQWAQMEKDRIVPDAGPLR